MVSYIGKLVALAAVVVPAVFAAPAPAPANLKIRNLEARDVVKDSYIVVYNPAVEADIFEASIAEVSSLISKRAVAGGIGAKYTIGDFKGYQITADTATLAEIAASPDVAYIEKDQKVYASALTSQTGATWGLGRISHTLQDSTTYIYDSTAGSGTTVYVVDTGILTTHTQFGGRATFGANYVDRSNTDGNGHGTHCAGTIAGSTYGVAKAAKLVAVKVLAADGSGTTSGVISGIQYVGTNAPAKSVLSMSLGGTLSTALNTAVRNTIAKGVTVVVAAGNDNKNAASFSPASEPLAITVGAIDINDNRASFSNFGALVDIFAPGVNVLSSWIGSNSATNTISGTSMATPHVAGLAAYLIALEGLSTPAAVQARIKALGIAGKVISPGTGSPNLIAYNGNGA
ncbi:uncharacterized protein L3040_007505 [Drepanopeziza brunnea f. sp. 'multigermtubi']|uniref:uncharacterized protein n=1 Tax=Drepanopeziza brunnea f. sp. 'multigermtubi' TaxID=698441 RepID=UPI0023837A9A|nr:hypothetical protein L3040_007505 [Drepanopeziza brunnea f. sp. 'multigermtubi']